MSQRFEMRLSDELMARLDGARGETPRATFIKRALESALGGLAEGAPPEGKGRREVGAEKAPRSPASVPAPSRTPASKRAPSLAQTFNRSGRLG